MTAQVWREKCLRMRAGKRFFRGVACSPEAKPVLSRRCREHRQPIPAETLAERGRPAYTGVGSEESKRKSRFKALSAHLQERKRRRTFSSQRVASKTLPSNKQQMFSKK